MRCSSATARVRAPTSGGGASSRRCRHEGEREAAGKRRGRSRMRWALRSMARRRNRFTQTHGSTHRVTALMPQPERSARASAEPGWRGRDAAFPRRGGHVVLPPPPARHHGNTAPQSHIAARSGDEAGPARATAAERRQRRGRPGEGGEMCGTEREARRMCDAVGGQSAVRGPLGVPYPHHPPATTENTAPQSHILRCRGPEAGPARATAAEHPCAERARARAPRAVT